MVSPAFGIHDIFYWNEASEDRKPAYTVWKVFSATSDLFKNAGKQYCWNYRVDDLELLMGNLYGNGINPSEPAVEDENGKFAFIHDPEQNKIILWEPSGLAPTPQLEINDRVTGLGGVFFRSENVPALKKWYKNNLGFDTTDWGCTFRWIDPKDPAARVPARTEWSPFKHDTDYFSPSDKQFMLNYRVKDLTKLLADLKREGVETVGTMDEYSYGKFGWALDCEGNKMELWEPIDAGLEAEAAS